MALSVLQQVIIMIVYMSMGFTLCKAHIAVPSHAKTLSAILVYILGPCMVINSFITTEYSNETFANILLFFLATACTQILFFIILYLIFHKKYDDAKYRILTIASVLGNVGFFGQPVVVGLFPDEPIVACYSSMYVMSMNLLVFTMGTYLITNDKKYISLKGTILNPTTIAILISLPLFIFRITLPAVASDAIYILGKMVTPICMIILGMRLSTVGFKTLFTRKFVYLSCALKLIVYPFFAYGLVCLLPFVNSTFKTCVFVLSAAPAGAIIESLSELYECEQELSANAVLLTTILSVITIPIVVSVFL